MEREKQHLARCGEDLARQALQRRGYRILERNWRCRVGEVDLVAQDGDTLVFVEIKTRRGAGLGAAKEAVHARKQRQLSKVALAYLKLNGGCGRSARFDVVAVNVTGSGAEIELVKNAFDLAY